MPRVAQYADKRFIVGLGLDEVIEEGDLIILLDEEFGDVYGDYLFLGYDVLAETIDTRRADVVGLYTVKHLLGKGRGIVVCGRDPVPCTAGLAAYIALEKGAEPLAALREAWQILRPIYERRRIGVPLPLASGLKALARIVDIVGEYAFSAIFSVASGYEYGYGRASYGDLLAWLNNLGASEDALVAGALSFLALSLHGAPAEVLRYRLEAVGESSLLALLGPRAEKAVAILKELAENRLESEEAALLSLVTRLGPGTETTRYVDREGGSVIVYCTGSEPSRACMAKIREAEEVREKTLAGRLERIKLVLGEPEPVVIEA